MTPIVLPVLSRAATERGPSLVLGFADMDDYIGNVALDVFCADMDSWVELQALDLRFDQQTYSVWEAPAAVQGTYRQWEIPAEPQGVYQTR